MLSTQSRKKGLVEDHAPLDIANFTPYVGRIGRPELLSWDDGKNQIGAIAYPESVRLVYTSSCADTGEKANHDYSIRLETIPCHFGGVRRWFLCPRCGRRCWIVYMESSLDTGSNTFACCLCLGLTYRNTQTGRFMSRAYEWDDKGLPLLERARRARKPERKVRLLERASKYYRGFWDIIVCYLKRNASCVWLGGGSEQRKFREIGFQFSELQPPATLFWSLTIIPNRVPRLERSHMFFSMAPKAAFVIAMSR